MEYFINNLTGFSFACLYGSAILTILCGIIGVIATVQWCKVFNMGYKIMKEYYKKLRRENENE